MPGSEELSFKEMCARFDVTPRTLRYYEYIELLQPRKDGRSRFYSSREVARMTLILRGRRFGFSLEEIRQWLEIYDMMGDREQFEVWIDKANRKTQASFVCTSCGFAGPADVIAAGNIARRAPVSAPCCSGTGVSPVAPGQSPAP